MVTSYGETSGFSAIGAGELDYVNGGKGGSGGGGSSASKIPGITTTMPGAQQSASGSSGVSVGSGGISFPYGDGRVVIGGDIGSKTVSATYTRSK
jgi:hypothetical protein